MVQLPISATATSTVQKNNATSGVSTSLVECRCTWLECIDDLTSGSRSGRHSDQAYKDSHLGCQDRHTHAHLYTHSTQLHLHKPTVMLMRTSLFPCINRMSWPWSIGPHFPLVILSWHLFPRLSLLSLPLYHCPTGRVKSTAPEESDLVTPKQKAGRRPRKVIVFSSDEEEEGEMT